MFDLLLFLKTLLGGLNVPEIETKAAAWLEEKGADFPDLKDRADALAAFLKTTLAEASPSLDPATMANTLKGIAEDIVAGASGVDRGSWMGG